MLAGAALHWLLGILGAALNAFTPPPRSPQPEPPRTLDDWITERENAGGNRPDS